jgi:hypothetical protein
MMMQGAIRDGLAATYSIMDWMSCHIVNSFPYHLSIKVESMVTCKCYTCNADVNLCIAATKREKGCSFSHAMQPFRVQKQEQVRASGGGGGGGSGGGQPKEDVFSYRSPNIGGGCSS